MGENLRRPYYRSRYFWPCCLLIMFILIFLGCLIYKLNKIEKKITDIECCNPLFPVTEINTICVDTIYKDIVDPNDTTKVIVDTIFKNFYCSQIVVDGVNDSNKSGLDSLLKGGFKILRSCACDSIQLLGRATKLKPEEVVRVCRGDIVDESSGLGSGLNYLIELPPRTENDSIVFRDNIPWKPNPPISTDTIRVAIIDSGVDFGHPSLNKFIWKNQQEQDGILGKDEDGNWIKDDLEGYDFANEVNTVIDSNGHGTHIGGIITRQLSNQYKVELMNLKVIGVEKGDLFNLACALHYAIDKKAQIINLSLGYYAPDTSIILDKLFKKTHDKDILVITSAGNKGYNNDTILTRGRDTLIHFPSSFNQIYDNVLAVAALRNNFKTGEELLDISNYGFKHVDIATKGEDVLSTYIDIQNNYSGPVYIRLTGTSMAAAHLSKIATILLFNNPGDSPQVIKSKIILKAQDSIIIGDKKVRYGIVNSTNPIDYN